MTPSISDELQNIDHQGHFLSEEQRPRLTRTIAMRYTQRNELEYCATQSHHDLRLLEESLAHQPSESVSAP